MKVDVNDLIRRLGNGDSDMFSKMKDPDDPTHTVVLKARALLVMWSGVIRSAAALYEGCKAIAEDPTAFGTEAKVEKMLERVKKVSGLAEGYLDDTSEAIAKEIEHLEALKTIKDGEEYVY